MDMDAWEPEDRADRDSALGSELPEEVRSIRSSIIEYRREYGRTYHSYKDGKYVFPNDHIENDRLELQHHMFYLMYEDRLGLCPLNKKGAKVNRVLDIGCGTGNWTMDYGDDHPGAEVVGVDLSPIQPTFVPPNVHFEIDDLEEPWQLGPKFDYIHSRMMTGSFADWDGIFQKCYNYLEPGGYLEVAELGLPYETPDGTLLESHAHYRWSRLILEAAEAIGRPFVNLKTLPDRLRKAGFQDLEIIEHKWPINDWPKGKRWKELGLWTLENVSTGLESFSYALFTRGLGWAKEDVDEFLVEVRRDLVDPAVHAYIPLCTVYCRKPS